MSSTTFSIPIHRLQAHARQQQTHALRLSTLGGGYVAAKVYRLDLEFGENGGTPLSFVQKHTTANEVRIMQLLAQNLRHDTLPLLIDSYIDSNQPLDNGASWFIAPFYGGRLLDFDDDMPLSIVNILAAVHFHFSSRSHEIDWLPQVDAGFVSGLLRLIDTQLNENTKRLPASTIDALRRQFAELDYAAALDKVFQQLPKTLTHGDIHPGNIIELEDGNHLLFDWGNARLAPATLDLANLVQRGSPEWEAYLAAWQGATGKPLDADVAQRGYDWATAIVNLQYLPFAIGYLEPSVIEEMADKVKNAVAALQN